MRRAPGAERQRGLAARINVHEDGTLGVQRDQRPESEVGLNAADRPPRGPAGTGSLVRCRAPRRPQSSVIMYLMQ